jgi:hypothetical protein
MYDYANRNHYSNEGDNKKKNCFRENNNKKKF